MKKTQNYLTPEISEFEIRTEGILCESSVGAGTLDDNSWDLTFGEPIN